MSTRHHFFREIGVRPFYYTWSANAYSQNLATIYTANSGVGAPSSISYATFQIASGIWLGSNTGTHALAFGTWPTGSIIIIINLGYVAGYGGSGNSGSGGNAMSIDSACNATVSIDNTYGYIYGGGGGGGQGYDGGAGGAPGGSGASGSAGDRSSFGAGGAASLSDQGLYGGDGGVGGTWGNTGATSSPSVYGNTSAGGGPGKAIQLNGHSVTWIGGNNGTQVKGAVS